MTTEVTFLKNRIFGIDVCDIPFETEPETQFSLDEILEALSRQEEGIKAIVFSEEKNQSKTIKQLEEQVILVDEKGSKKPDILLYEFMEGAYYVYSRKSSSRKEEDFLKTKQRSESEHSYGLFAPTGVIVRRVPQNILGNGVLGRAFIFQNYIEILDSLIGNEYTEVLTHEVLHIMYPEKRELEIRQMTRNYIGTHNTIYH